MVAVGAQRTLVSSVVGLVGLVTAIACASDHSGESQSAAADAGGDGGPRPDCLPAVSGDPVSISDPEQAYISYPSFTWTGDGFVGVWHGPGGQGYRVAELSPDGAPRSALRTLWATERGAQGPRLAVSGDVLAIVDQASEGASARQICRLALARLGGQDPIRAPARFSDVPEDESILNEAHLCNVAAAGDGFMLVWQQNVSRTSTAWSVFAQRVALDGAAVGSRLTLVSGDMSKHPAMVSVTSDGTRVLIAPSVLDPTGPSVSLLVVEGDQVSTVPWTLGPAPPDLPVLAPAHDGFFALANGQLSTLDREARVVEGPVAVGLGAFVGPLGSGFVVVSHDEFPVATTLGASLRSRSEPVGLSSDRRASVQDLVHAPDGSATAVLYTDDGGLRFARLVCSNEPPVPPGPGACPVTPVVAPLDDGCAGPVCHVAIRLDYLTLGVRGWTSAGGPASSVDTDGARAAAQAVFDANGQYLSPDTTVSGPVAGLFTVSVSPGDFGAMALIGEQSGLVVAAGGVVWSGRGDYWVPSTWNPAADLACGEEPVAAAEVYLDPGDCSSFEPGATPATANQALDVALRTNVAAHVAAEGPFSAFTYLYTPTVGTCDPGVAEYLVVLSQLRP